MGLAQSITGVITFLEGRETTRETGRIFLTSALFQEISRDSGLEMMGSSSVPEFSFFYMKGDLLRRCRGEILELILLILVLNLSE